MNHMKMLHQTFLEQGFAVLNDLATRKGCSPHARKI